MKKHILILSTLAAIAISLTGCGVVEGIFKAGMIWGIILVFIVVFAILWLFNRGRRK